MGHREKIPVGQYLQGLREVKDNLQAAIYEMTESSAEGLANASLFILGEAAQNAPVETGNLRGSGYIQLDGEDYAIFDQPTITKEESKSGAVPPLGDTVILGAILPSTKSAKIGFSAIYAADQHEQEHLTHPRGGGPKYLEHAMNDNTERVLKTIAGKMQESL